MGLRKRELENTFQPFQGSRSIMLKAPPLLKKYLEEQEKQRKLAVDVLREAVIGIGMLDRRNASEREDYPEVAEDHDDEAPPAPEIDSTLELLLELAAVEEVSSAADSSGEEEEGELCLLCCSSSPAAAVAVAGVVVVAVGSPEEAAVAGVVGAVN